MVIDNKKVTIRPENPSEYEKVDEIIYEAFAEQHGIEIGKETQLNLSQSAVLPKKSRRACVYFSSEKFVRYRCANIVCISK